MRRFILAAHQKERLWLPLITIGIALKTKLATFARKITK